MCPINRERELFISGETYLSSVVSPNFLTDLADVERRLVGCVEVLPAQVGKLEWPPVEALGNELDAATSRARRRSAELLDEHLRANPRSPLVGSVSVFAALGHCRYEVAHTQALGWLLNPRESHGFEARILESFLAAIEPNEEVDIHLLNTARNFVNSSAGGENESARGSGSWRAYVSTEHYLSPRCRADVLVLGTNAVGEQWTLVIEAKIDARERPLQLQDLLASAPNEKKFGVFLTTDGARGTTSDGGWVSLSYKQWARALIKSSPAYVGCPGADFLRVYITGLLMDVCDIRCGRSAEETLKYNNPFDIEMLLGD